MTETVPEQIGEMNQEATEYIRIWISIKKFKWESNSNFLPVQNGLIVELTSEIF